MSKPDDVKKAVEKVETTIKELVEQMKATRVAVEQLTEGLQSQLEQVVKQAGSVAQEINRDITTFQEQRQLVESQLTSEVERAKQLSDLKDIEESIQVIREVIDELSKKVDLRGLSEAVTKFESEQKS